MTSYPRPLSGIRDPDELRSIFDAVEPLTVGLEEEATLVDAETLRPVARAAEVVERLGGDARFKLELPAAQLEIVLPPTATVAESAVALDRARRELAAATDGIGRIAAAGVHPLA